MLYLGQLELTLKNYFFQEAVLLSTLLRVADTQ